MCHLLIISSTENSATFACPELALEEEEGDTKTPRGAICLAQI